MKRVLLFDFDGVIGDSFDVMVRSFMRAAESHPRMGAAGMAENYLSLFDGNLYSGLRQMEPDENKLEEFNRAWKAEIEKNLDDIAPFPGIIKSISRLSKACRLFIVSSGNNERIRYFLDSHGVDSIDGIFGVEHGKSKTEKITRIKSDFPDSEIFYIGDTKGDVVEAREAGVKSVAVTWGIHGRSRLQEANPDFIVDSPEDLANLFLKK